MYATEKCYIVVHKNGSIVRLCEGRKNKKREELPKSKSPWKTTDVVTSSEDKEAKGKHQHIAGITEGAPRENILTKGTMKRNIVDMLVHKKDDECQPKPLTSESRLPGL